MKSSVHCTTIIFHAISKNDYWFNKFPLKDKNIMGRREPNLEHFQNSLKNKFAVGAGSPAV